MKFSIVAIAAFALSANAANHKVKVGSGGLTFKPSTVKAAVGDTVEFDFIGSGHAVAEGDFNNACQPLAGAPFYSGPGVAAGKKWQITIKDTSPHAFYCPPHCKLGMVGVINPSGSSTAKKFKASAKASASSKYPTTAQGGQYI